MAEKKLYSIGEISEITDTSGKTLRYYDTIGLLTPGYKNPDTLYRYYTKDQVFSVFLIKKLQTLGFSLKEIQVLMSEDTPDIYTKEVSKKMKHLRKKIDEMERIYTEGILFIDKLQMKQERLDYFDIKEHEDSAPRIEDQIRNHEIRVEAIPEMDVLYTRKRMTDYNNVEISVNRWIEKCVPMPWERTFSILVVFINPSAQSASADAERFCHFADRLIRTLGVFHCCHLKLLIIYGTFRFN